MNNLVVIGGTTKAATTSLFNYLCDHPEICKSSFKETRFFLDIDYPLPRKLSYVDGVEKYKEFFNSCYEKYVIDATPSYLYSRTTPSLIKTNFPNAKYIFILRNPIDRLFSWFRYAKQIGDLESEVSFTQFIALQEEHNIDVKECFMAKKQGKYFEYLSNYLSVINQNNILVVLYEELSDHPNRTMKKICTFLDIDIRYYDQYIYSKENVTKDIKSHTLHQLFLIYKKFKYTIRMYTHDKLIHQVLRKLNTLVSTLYYKANANVNNISTQEIPRRLEIELAEYYAEDIAQLSQFMDQKIDWLN